MAATSVVRAARKIQVPLVSCGLSFTTTTFLHLGHFSQELSSGFQQRRPNFFWISQRHCQHRSYHKNLIQFRRLRGFAKQLLWDRCFQQLPNSIVLVRTCTLPAKRPAVLTSHFSGESSASAKRKTDTF